jgi:hypothetical protein
MLLKNFGVYRHFGKKAGLPVRHAIKTTVSTAIKWELVNGGSAVLDC